jgi:hypothetical protein
MLLSLPTPRRQGFDLPFAFQFNVQQTASSVDLNAPPREVARPPIVLYNALGEARVSATDNVRISGSSSQDNRYDRAEAAARA